MNESPDVNYDLLAGVAFVAVLYGLTAVGRYLAFKVPALQRMRELNLEADRPKLRRTPYREAVKRSSKAGLITSLVFYAAILPWCLTLESRPLWRHVVDIVAVLMVFDFLYYLTHRYLIHGRSLRRIHSQHHQADGDVEEREYPGRERVPAR